jgi:DNA-binding response OmpR family regulator
MKILIVEDDQATSEVLHGLIETTHGSADIAGDGLAGLALAEQCEYDVIVVDVTLPKLDGISLCRQLRERGYQNSILILTANNQTSDRVQGLDAGADDYLVKPYEPAELLARIRALSRRGKVATTAQITWENMCLDASRNEVTNGDKIINLTAKEYCLLELFLHNPQRIFSRSAILDKLWDFSESPGEQTVCTHIKCVRQKLKAAQVNDPIETVHGLGYRRRSPQPTTIIPDSALDIIPAKIDRIWEKFQDKFLAQVSILDQAAILLQEQQLTTEQQTQARYAAHSLAGSLGIFGFAKGSQLAKEIENTLQSVIPISLTIAGSMAKLIAALQQELTQREPIQTPNVANSVSNLTLSNYQPAILIIDEDLVFSDRLRLEAISWELRVEVATNVSSAKQSMERYTPDVILLDLSGAASPVIDLNLLQELTQRRIPMVAFTSTNLDCRWNIDDRLALLAAGSCIFLEKTQSFAAVFSAVNSVLQRQQVLHHNRVMVVDDDPLILAKLGELLRPYGIDVVLLSDIKQFWEVLNSQCPNLLIIDLEMPDYQGTDLCKIVRSDLHWQDLPIVFLSAHQDQAQIDQAFLAGADDYLSKFTAPKTLVQNVLCRLKKGGFQPMTVSSQS